MSAVAVVKITLPNVFYCLGSTCFFVGTVMNMVRAR